MIDLEKLTMMQLLREKNSLLEKRVEELEIANMKLKSINQILDKLLVEVCDRLEKYEK